MANTDSDGHLTIINIDADPVNENWLRIIRASKEGRWHDIVKLSGGSITAIEAEREGKANRQMLMENPIATECPELNMLWAKYAAAIVNKGGVRIPDTEDGLNRHAFLGHSLDMQGFRAAEFEGTDSLSKNISFVPLNERGLGIRELGELWEVDPIRSHLQTMTTPKAAGTPMKPTIAVLSAEGGTHGKALADALHTFTGYRIQHKFVRALLENSAKLKQDGYSFRQWLKRECEALKVEQFPPHNFRDYVQYQDKTNTLEKSLCIRLIQTFYLVGPAMAPYMLCDWQLGLWTDTKTDTFDNFKPDTFHTQFVQKYGRGMVPSDIDGFVAWWHQQEGCAELPPRLANECIWLGIEHGDV